MNTTTTLRPLCDIAADILAAAPGAQTWAAQPYLDGLSYCWTRHDTYGFDSAESLILYALSNLRSFRGEDARRLKAELKAHLSE